MDTECLNRGCRCAGSSVEPKKVPLDMYILFDQSASMNENAGNGTKWTVITGALTSFAQNMASAGIGMGLGYFPWAPPATAPTSCTADADCTVNGTNYGTCVLDGTLHIVKGGSQ